MRIRQIFLMGLALSSSLSWVGIAVGQSAPIIRATSVDFLGTGEVSGYSGTDDLSQSVVNCPAGTHVTGIQGFSPNGKEGIVNLRYSCNSASNAATAAGFNGAGTVSGYAGTDDLSHPWVSCPEGYFVSAIQGFSLNNHYVISNLRYICTLNSSTSVVRATTQSLAQGTGSVSGLSGSDGLSTPDVSCPQGTFITAIQGFIKSNNSTGLPLRGIYGVRYICAPQ